MKKIAGNISPLQKFLASPPQNEIRAARPALIVYTRSSIFLAIHYLNSTQTTQLQHVVMA